MLLAANEYPVSWASLAAATILGIHLTMGAGLLQPLGLLTRLAGALLGRTFQQKGQTTSFSSATQPLATP